MSRTKLDKAVWRVLGYLLFGVFCIAVAVVSSYNAHRLMHWWMGDDCGSQPKTYQSEGATGAFSLSQMRRDGLASRPEHN